MKYLFLIQTQIGVKMYVSICCGAEVDKDYMICSECLEHLGDEDIEEEEFIEVRALPLHQ